MKKVILITLVAMSAVLSGCHKEPEPVAMNYYSPSGDKEVVSGIQVEITEEMIEQMRKRKAQSLK